MTNATSPEIKDSGVLDLAPRLGTWLEEYGEISTILPVLVGLFVTSRLQIRGATALLVNLTLAAFTRQVVVQLKKQAHPTTSVATAVNQQSASADDHTAEDYTIIHSTPGRLRLRIPRLVNDVLYAKQLEKLLIADEGVIRVRLNRAAASLVIQYDGAGVSELELGMRLLQILDRAERHFQPQPTDKDTEAT
ncbi:hypothetical protein NO976_03542 [Planktothrix agardhii]|jgi:hypothetical protein|uniref:Metal ABC transporter ATPase n=1 Tax=Planktothrix agardhii TaxID=1160 RepID=A0A1J1JBB2_PLAAG|nr:hypothetical protein [Planktothrix agardhii]MBG0745866.1 hypothetical protein [Planktothrix agardhii KL2]MCF3576089.1 hypothetical protein [Planktothrix agardhii 1812]MCF3580102.1 hypothetical protein [Planktothrix agardhii 1811]MCF3624669.1 hypothetical protein [Planktothrix agardhii 1801]CAD5965125.1 hypothetical protein NO976_03542 [Planktothrix agardhii]